MSLLTGNRLGPYEIVSPLGAGGMGEVYRARDTRLDRTVAIKVLASHLSSSQELKQRLEREARAISSLNHAHICQLYDIGSHDGADFLVMEFLEGETLAERLRKGPIAMPEILKIGIAIGEALAVAHRQGIVHRDLKPGNIMLTHSGAKLMDFGLAKPIGMQSSASATSNLPSFTAVTAVATVSGPSPVSPLTTAGSIVGTVQYMSPEQIEGKEADARSDIFAFGAVLYEMAAGRRPFEGKSQISLASSILEKEPEPISAIKPEASPAFEHVVRMCLAKHPDERFQSAYDVLLELKWAGGAASQSGAGAVLERGHKLQFRAAWTWAALSTAALLIIGLIWLLRPLPPMHPAVRAYLQPTKGSTFNTAEIAISPDGTKLAYQQIGVSNPRLFIQSLSSGIAQPISESAKASWPAFSPDGKYVAFCDDTKVQKYDVAGGQLLTIADAGNCGYASWNAAGTIIFDNRKAIMQVSAGGGTPAVVLPGDEKTRFYAPNFLPDGRHFFVALRKSASDPAVPPDNSIAIGDLKTRSYQVLLPTGSGSGIANIPVSQYADGILLYSSQGNLMARHFDPGKLQLTGDSVVLGPVQGLFAVSPAGVLAYSAPGEAAKSELGWIGRSGQQLGRITEGQLYDNVRISPDGSRMAYQLYAPATANPGTIWVYDINRGVSSRVTFDSGASDDRPVWSPDGKYLLYSRFQDGSMYKVLASGLGGEEVVLQNAYPDDWSSDGRYIAYDSGTPPQIGVYDVPEKKSSNLLSVKSANHDARFSPDSNFLAYTSDESGQSEIYVVPFPSLNTKWQVSVGGGTRASWRRDGKEVYYLSSDAKLMAVPVTHAGDGLNFGKPVALFQGSFELTGANVGRPYDPSADGQKFVMNTAIETTAQPLTIVTNWTSLLNK
jgi:eukaryotic-like serine/threonine-protein kinase